MRRVVVTRAPLRLWVLALAGVIMMVLAFDAVIDLSLGQLMELDGPIRALFVVLEDPSGIPDQLRGLVRVDHWTLAVHASGWSEPPEVVLEGLQSLRREHGLA